MDSTAQIDNLVTNLKWLCATRKSVSQICREIGLNRQQFARYLAGTSTPSPHSLRRVCEHFGVEPTDMTLPPERFRARFARRSEGGRSALAEIGQMLGLNMAALRAFEGYYQTYYISPSWPGDILCCLACLTEQGGHMNVKTIERLRDDRAEISQTVKYSGFASYSRKRLMIVEMTSGHSAPIVTETILEPPTLYQKGYLRGLTFGMSWRIGNTPYCSPTIWQSLGPAPNIQAALRNCGRLRLDAPTLPFAVRRFFEQSPETFSLPD
ncbi:MAG TPA: helix-turn-helix transcriptional regulator [Paenirhodobacter sp.]